jgi:hypothetical protein
MAEKKLMYDIRESRNSELKSLRTKHMMTVMMARSDDDDDA